MFIKTIVKQEEELVRLNEENKTLYEENKENRQYTEELELEKFSLETSLRQKEKVLNQIIRLAFSNKYGNEKSRLDKIKELVRPLNQNQF